MTRHTLSARPMFLAATLALLAHGAASTGAASPASVVRDAGISGGLIAQVGSDDLGLKELGGAFHVRILLGDAAAVAKAQAAIDQAGLQGRFTVSAWDGKRLPFAERVVNALVAAGPDAASDEEVRRVLAPRGLWVKADGATAAPVPEALDEWTHFLYDASGNAVSRDREVATPRSFRWYAPPFHLRSHNWGASFLGLVTGGGRIFHFLDEGSFLLEEGGLAERWSLVARDAFNGALLWKRPLDGYGQTFFEEVGSQPTSDNIWRSPLSINRRMVVHGGRLYAALSYRKGPLSVLDAATGKTLREIDLGGIVDEIIADGPLVVCRVRAEIDMPENKFTPSLARAKAMEAEGVPKDKAKGELQGRLLDHLRGKKNERVAAVDAESGKVLWQRDAPVVAHQALAMAEGKVVYHNYEALTALDAKTGAPAWEFANPATDRNRFGSRGSLGALLITEKRVVWASAACGGGVCLDLATGQKVWANPRFSQQGGFGFPLATRVVNGVIWFDTASGLSLASGENVKGPDLAGMLKRGHHVRCFPGKATERFLITPMRGAEFVDLKGEEHMINDWIRGTCSLGNLPANGLFYTTPDPCACYSGAKVNGFHAFAPALPPGLDQAPPPADPSRLEKGPAFQEPVKPAAGGWTTYRGDDMRTGRATTPLPPALAVAWERDLGGDLTPATLGGGRVFVARKDTYELICLDQASGAIQWRRSFPGALDGPPTVVGGRLFTGCRDGHVYSLRAADGELAWKFLAAPLPRLTLSQDRLESAWPVSAGVLYAGGLVYAVAGRNSFLDRGVHLYALDPASGAVRHHTQIDGPHPTREQLRTPVLSDKDADDAAGPKLDQLKTQLASGYDVEGADADLLVTDGKDLYMRQNKFTPALERAPLTRADHIGIRPMGGMHLMPQFGFMDDTMYHRSFWTFDDTWPGKAGGGGVAARGGTILAVGQKAVYAAKHYEGGWYPVHKPGTGNLLVADAFETDNMRGDMIDKEVLKKASPGRPYGNSSDFMRTAPPLWQTPVPILIRAILAAPGADGADMVFSAGVVEGSTNEQWNEAGHWRGPAKLLVHKGADGSEAGAIDLPACPVFDGMASAEGRLILALSNGRVVCLGGP